MLILQTLCCHTKRMATHHKHTVSHLLKTKFPHEHESNEEAALKSLQLKMLRIQQGIWHAKRRAIVVFEGFDTAGKGGAIRRLTETLDPRGFRVHPIGPPDPVEQGKHYLYRFWQALPATGTIAIFDRSWYGRVLVERVEKLAPKERLQAAYDEINEFEAMLTNDGVDIIKVFLAIHPEEQLARFEARLHDKYKQWKLTDDDVEAHYKWDEYVAAIDEMLYRTNSKKVRWNVVEADSKPYARRRVLEIVTDGLSHHHDWLAKLVEKKRTNELKESLKRLEKIQKNLKKKHR